MLYVAVAVIALLLVLLAFLKADARKIATAMRVAGPAMAGIIGIILLVAGRAGIGGMLLSGAAAWYVRSRARVRAQPSKGKSSTVRTAAIEMELDHDSGRLEGMVLAGSFEGRQLSDLDLEELLEFGGELTADSESLQLLETYLDGRFPVWRAHSQANMGSGQAGAPASGSMTKQEAYEILGLEPGAGAADIRKAHRRLMQRLHPDLGGTSFLAARVNEAKEILLSDHK